MNEALPSKERRRWLFIAALIVSLIGYGVFGPSRLTRERQQSQKRDAPFRSSVTPRTTD
jgi:hypothetical protein